MGMEMYSTLLSPYDYGGTYLKNRIIFAPTSMGLKKEEYFKKLESISAGGCSMIIIGDVPIAKSKFGPSLFSKKGFAYYEELVRRIHAYDCKVCAQLHQSDTKMSGMFKYIPKLITKKMTANDLRKVMNEETGNYISSIPTEKVKSITNSFADAAQMAVKAGFDMVQVHGDRMCGSFSSSIFNHRTDEYGGTAENRARFAIESVRAIHERLPQLSIDYKLCVRQENPHYGNAGILVDEVKTFVPLLQEAGVTSFHVTLANHSRLEDPIPAWNHPEFYNEGCFLKFCDEVKKYTKLPVCGVGGFTHPEFVEESLVSHRVDCVSMCRQLIADPQWVNKVKDQKVDTIHWCRRCNKKCLNGMYEHKGVHCIYDEGEEK